MTEILYLFGGYNSLTKLPTRNIISYDLLENNLTLLSDKELMIPRIGAHSFLIPNTQYILILGGSYDLSIPYSQVTSEIFDTLTNTIIGFGPSMSTPRSSFSSLLLKDILWVFGGKTISSSLKTIEILDLRSVDNPTVFNATQSCVASLSLSSSFSMQYTPYVRPHAQKYPVYLVITFMTTPNPI